MFLAQGQNDISTYFTNLRILWDEHKHSQPIAWCTCSTCRCNSAMRWHNYQEEECTMQFLIGPSSSYSQIQSTILSTVPLPPISKVTCSLWFCKRKGNETLMVLPILLLILLHLLLSVWNPIKPMQHHLTTKESFYILTMVKLITRLTDVLVSMVFLRVLAGARGKVLLRSSLS